MLFRSKDNAIGIAYYSAAVILRPDHTPDSDKVLDTTRGFYTGSIKSVTNVTFLAIAVDIVNKRGSLYYAVSNNMRDWELRQFSNSNMAENTRSYPNDCYTSFCARDPISEEVLVIAGRHIAVLENQWRVLNGNTTYTTPSLDKWKYISYNYSFKSIRATQYNGPTGITRRYIAVGVDAETLYVSSSGDLSDTTWSIVYKTELLSGRAAVIDLPAAGIHPVVGNTGGGPDHIVDTIVIYDYNQQSDVSTYYSNRYLVLVVNEYGKWAYSERVSDIFTPLEVEYIYKNNKIDLPIKIRSVSSSSSSILQTIGNFITLVGEPPNTNTASNYILSTSIGSNLLSDIRKSGKITIQVDEILSTEGANSGKAALQNWCSVGTHN